VKKQKGDIETEKTAKRRNENEEKKVKLVEKKKER